MMARGRPQQAEFWCRPGETRPVTSADALATLQPAGIWAGQEESGVAPVLGSSDVSAHSGA